MILVTSEPGARAAISDVKRCKHPLARLIESELLEMASIHERSVGQVPVKVSCRIRPALPSESTRCCTGIATDGFGDRVLSLKSPRGGQDPMIFKFDRWVIVQTDANFNIHR